MGFADTLNTSLYGSSGAALASLRMQAYGEAKAELEGKAGIPINVAKALDVIRGRHLVSLAGVVSRAREMDGELTDRFGRQLSLPQGSTFFEPLYRQYLCVEAAPVLSRDAASYIWRDMPAEMYLARRIPDLTAADRAVLTDLGYIAAYDAAAGGEDPLPADEASGAKADEARYILKSLSPADMSKAAAAPIIVQAGSQTVIYVVGFIALLAVIGAVGLYIVPKILEKQSIDAGIAGAADYNKDAWLWNEAAAANASKIVDQCLEMAAAQGTSVDACAQYQQRMMPFVTPLNPGTVAQQIAGIITCNGDACWTWTGAGVVVGGVAGFLAAKRVSSAVT